MGFTSEQIKGRIGKISFQKSIGISAVLPAWISYPLAAAFSGSPTWGVIAGYSMQTVIRFSRFDEGL